MTFKQLVIRNISRNAREYSTYFLSSLSSVAIFFIFSILFFHPDLSKELQGSSQTVGRFANIGMSLAEMIVVLMSFVFLWYAFSLFFHKRKPQLSIFLTLGMSKKQLKKMLLLENALVGSSAIIGGIIIGLCLAKLILLIAQNIIGLNKTLPFYFPIKGILLTLVVYTVLFCLLSLFTLLTINRYSLISLKKGSDDSQKPPRASLFLSLASVLVILSGYGVAQLAAITMRRNFSTAVIMILLVSCVLLTILGTYLFFQQASIKLFQSMKQADSFLQKGNLLTISNLMFRMKSNAMMYFLISIIASIAFVGIGVSKSIGSDRFAATQGDSFSYVYSFDTKSAPNSSEYQENMTYHENNIKFMEETLKKYGFQPIVKKLNYIDVTFDFSSGSKGNQTLIPLSTYNEIAKAIGENKLSLPTDEQVVQLARTQTESSIANHIEPAKGKIENTNLNITLYRSDTQMTVSILSPLTVVTDHLFQTIATQKKLTQSSVTLFYFSDWVKSVEAHNIIKPYLDKKNQQVTQKENKFVASINNRDYSREFTKDETSKLNHITDKTIYYTSLFDTWSASKQANGMIMIISVLLGTVFFIFSSSIIYFKLFGELETDGKYHRSLHIIGVSKKQRHKMVTTEIFIMFFVPFTMSAFHFFAAMSAMKRLIDLPVYNYALTILSIYFIFQLTFFVLSRYKYLYELDKMAYQK